VQLENATNGASLMVFGVIIAMLLVIQITNGGEMERVIDHMMAQHEEGRMIRELLEN
jgi:hypothetical protein